ncbi:MAG TPA: hypothetical protein VFT69_12870 [Pseudolabrys sp.]|nr:hypothetical protein [Pseudolabrys sp.]
MGYLVSDEDLARAHTDPAFRQQLMAEHLGRLVAALDRTRQSDSQNLDLARQMREGAALAVALAGRIQRDDGGAEPEPGGADLTFATHLAAGS